MLQLVLTYYPRLLMLSENLLVYNTYILRRLPFSFYFDIILLIIELNTKKI